jgi:hypothetical protein
MAGGHMRAKANKADRECGMRGHEEKQMVDPIGQGFDWAEGGWKCGMVYCISTTLSILLVV